MLVNGQTDMKSSNIFLNVLLLFIFGKLFAV